MQILCRLALLSAVFRIWIMNGLFRFCSWITSPSSWGILTAWGITLWIYVMPGTFPIVAPWLLIHPCKAGVQEGWWYPCINQETKSRFSKSLGVVQGLERRAPQHRLDMCSLNMWSYCPQHCSPHLRRETGKDIPLPGSSSDKYCTHLKLLLVLIFK